MTEERAIYGCGGDPIDDDRADGIAPLPKPDLLADCAQGFVEGWTASKVRAYAAQQVAAERERCARIVESYRVPVGNSPAGELAAQWTMDALREIRDQIRGERS
jgi:hypothetical protein